MLGLTGGMSTIALLRTSAVISLLFAAGHSLGGTKHWSPMGDNDVLASMTAVRFDVMGVSRSYLDFYLGFGWTLSVFLLLQSVLLWQLSTLTRSNGVAVRPMIAAFTLANMASTAIAWYLILPVAALFSAILLLVLIAAFLKA